MLRVHSKCMGMMHHRLAQKEGFDNLLVGSILLDYQAKTRMVGRYSYDSVLLN